MDDLILALIVIFVTVIVFVSIITYVIFDNNSQNRRIGNEVTLVVSIIIGVFVTVIIQYNQYINQTRIKVENEKQRKRIFRPLYAIALAVQFPTKHILEKWDEYEKLDIDDRFKKIKDAVNTANKEYFDFKKHIENNMKFIDSSTYMTMIITERLYNDSYEKIMKKHNLRDNLNKLNAQYNLCITLIPTEYHDEEIKNKIDTMYDIMPK